MNFDIFKIKAIDKTLRNRLDDTEVKFLFDFLENIYQHGDKFQITAQSTFYNCSSCQRYLQGFSNYVALDGKELIMTFIANPDVNGSEELKLFLGN